MKDTLVDIRLVVFDLYKTLIDPVNETKIYTRLLTDIGLQTSEEFRQARRIALTEDFDNLTDFVKQIKPHTNINISKYNQEIEKELDSAKLYPEVIKILNGLIEKNLNIGLISNLASPYKIPFIKLGLSEYFNEVIFSCNIGLTKPNPEIYKKMIEKFNIYPIQALMIGDTIHSDVDGPKAIGMNAIHIDRTGNSANSIKSLDEIFKYI